MIHIILAIAFSVQFHRSFFKVPSVVVTHCSWWFGSTIIYLSILLLMIFFPILNNVDVKNLVGNPYGLKVFFI